MMSTPQPSTFAREMQQTASSSTVWNDCNMALLPRFRLSASLAVMAKSHPQPPIAAIESITAV